MNFKFQGVWISPDGDVVETDDIQSHYMVLNRQDIKNIVVSESKKLNIQMTDLTMASMKVGFMRILNYGGQVAIEYIRNPNQSQNNAIMRTVREYVRELSDGFSVDVDQFTVENSETNNIMIFRSLNELKCYLDSITC